MKTTPIDIMRPLAPEDVREDDFITVTASTAEWFNPACDLAFRSPQVHRIRFTPSSAGSPLRVVRVCVPFLLVKDPAGRHTTLDLRRHQIARLSRDYGKKAFKCLAPSQPREEDDNA